MFELFRTLTTPMSSLLRLMFPYLRTASPIRSPAAFSPKLTDIMTFSEHKFFTTATVISLSCLHFAVIYRRMTVVANSLRGFQFPVWLTSANDQRTSCRSSTVMQTTNQKNDIFPLSQQSRTQSLQAFWSAGQRREDSGDIEFYYRRISAVKQWKPLRNSQSKKLNFFDVPRVFPALPR